MTKKLKLLLLSEKRDYIVEKPLGQKIDWKAYNASWYTRLFDQALEKECDLDQYGPGFKNFDKNQSLSELASRKPYDAVIVRLSREQGFKDFNEIKPLKVNIAGDLFDGGFRMQRYREHHSRCHYDLMLCYSELTQYWAYRWEYADNFEFLPFSADININQNLFLPKQYDVMACFNSWARAKRSLNRHRIKILISRKMPIRHWTDRAYYMDHVWKINQSKICMNYAHQGFFNPRYFEILACGGFLLTSQPKYDFNSIGLMPVKHFATYSNLEDLPDIINYWLTHKKERKRIARRGMRYARRYHSTKRRARQMIGIINKYL